jgi:type II secretory pathway component PulC
VKKIFLVFCFSLTICFARDPFFLLKTSDSKNVSHVNRQTLLGIIDGGVKKSALIEWNGESEVVEEGALLGSYKVATISRESVLLEKNGKKRILKMKK